MRLNKEAGNKHVANENSMNPTTISTMLSQRISGTPEKNAFFYKQGKEWKGVSWQEYGQRVDAVAKSLLALGASQGDKIALIGHNTPHWFVTDMAIMTSGFVTVPIYESNSPEQILYIINHSEAKIFVVEDTTYLERIVDRLDEAPGLEYVIVQNGNPDTQAKQVLTLPSFLEKGSVTSSSDLDGARNSISPDQLSTLLYTSGTTGAPKAVMLTHKNSVAAATSLDLSLKPQWGGSEKKSCSYLPLSHIAERVVSLIGPMLDGREVYLFEDMAKIMEDVKQVHPTIWLGVPRVWEKIFEGVRDYREELPGLKKGLINWSLAVGLRCNKRLQQNQQIGFRDQMLHAIAKKLVINKMLESLGLDQVRISVTGGAPSRPEISDFFSSLGLWLQEVYGQTEGHGTTSFASNIDFQFGSCGRPFPLVEVKIADDGEILVRGDNVSPGYYKDAELTAATFIDGWLHSGDLGHLDERGHLWVVGRKKDIIITSGGKNITAQKIEQALCQLEIVNYAMVVGDGRKYLTALLDLNQVKALKAIRVGSGSDNDKKGITEQEQIESLIAAHVAEVNKSLSRVEQIKSYIILFDAATLENELLTSTLKLRKDAVLAKYSDEIDKMYSSGRSGFLQ